MPHKTGKFMKTVMNNGQCDSPLQFRVKYDTDKAKKVKPKQVFEYTPPQENIKNRLRSRKKNN